MDEYISRQEAIKALYEVYEHDYPTASGDFDEYARHDVRNVLNGLPSADVQPVKHGRWEVNGDRFYPFCSNCKYEPPKELIRCNALSLEPILTKYCPNCGSENGTRIYKGR